MWAGSLSQNKRGIGGRMDRKMLIEHLARADEHIAKGDRHISVQRDLVAKLKRDGHNSTNAESLLTIMLETQAVRGKHRKLLLAQLGE